MLGHKLVKAGWDKADCIAGPLRPDLPSTGMLKMQSYSIGACTQINWVSASQTHDVGMRGVCEWIAGARCVSQSIEHCVTEEGNTLAKSCSQAHHHCSEMSPNHILQTLGPCCPCTMFVCLCLSPSPCRNCVSGLNTPGLPSESCWLVTHILVKTTV